MMQKRKIMSDASVIELIDPTDEAFFGGILRQYIEELRLACADIVEGGDRVEELKNSLVSGVLKGFLLTRNGTPSAFMLFREVEGLLYVHHFFVEQAWRDGRSGMLLLTHVKDHFSQTGGLVRLTCAFFPSIVDFGAEEVRALGFAPYERFAMERALTGKIAEAHVSRGFSIAPLEDRHLVPLSRVLHETNRGNVDNEIRPGIFQTPEACLIFLNQIMSGAYGMFNYHTSLLVFEDRSVLGAIFGTYRLNGSGFIAANFIHPEYQGRSLGKALLLLLLQKFHDFGALKVSLCVSAANERAWRLYEKNGFEITARYFEALYPPTSPP
jgi:GNAT superfamily N-acetyltransferase